jgi:hypothetical protein
VYFPRLNALLGAALVATAVSACQIDAVTGTTASHAPASSPEFAHAASPSTLNRDLAQLRRLTAPYHNLDKALAAGYIMDPVCVSHPTLGTMGYHAVNPTLRNDAEISLLEPDVLVYEKMPNGRFRLNAVEYFVLKSTWETAHGAGAAPPTLFGHDVPLSDHPPFGPHYELHVWVFRHNPSGMFASWNPEVICR